MTHFLFFTSELRRDTKNQIRVIGGGRDSKNRINELRRVALIVADVFFIIVFSTTLRDGARAERLNPQGT